MAPIGSACQAPLRWLSAALAASPASFHPSKAATTTGPDSLAASESSIAHHLLSRRAPRRLPAYVLAADHLVPQPGGRHPGRPAPTHRDMTGQSRLEGL